MHRKTIALIGAGGKMGSRIRPNLRTAGIPLIACEKDETSILRLKEEGYDAMHTEEALPLADVVVFALPDAAIPNLSKQYLPLLKPGALILTLDPAAARAGLLAMRDDCHYFVVHPCHPSLYAKRDTEAEKADVFGGIAAIQDIVLARISGTDEDYDLIEALCKEMFAPVDKAFRITVEQMALLEPAAAEVVVALCATIMKEAIEESVKRGVPRDAAESFLLGHIQIPLAIVLKSANPFSDAALIAVDYGKKHVLKENWKDVFEPEKIDEVLALMLHVNEQSL